MTQLLSKIADFRLQLIMYLLLLLQVPLIYGQGNELLKDQSVLSFRIKNFGVNVQGSFERYAVDANIDSLSMGDSFIKVSIEVASVKTGIDKRDRHLLEEKFFAEKMHPFMSYESLTVKKVGNDTYISEGLVTIKGVQKNIRIPFQLLQDSNQNRLIAEFELNRMDFGVGSKSWTLSDIVKISVSFDFKN